MSSSVQNCRIVDTTSQWELAQRLAGQAKAPETVLRSLFQGVMQGIEKMAKAPFDDSLKEKVWKAVSKDRLNTLKETLILEFCNQILKGFNGAEIGAMLAEHKGNGVIQDAGYSVRLQTLYTLSQNSITEAIAKKGSSMADDWVPEIVNALTKEGIQLPLAKKPENE